MGDASLITLPHVEHLILIIRDTKVIIDRDLAALYGVATKVLNQAVTKEFITYYPSDCA